MKRIFYFSFVFLFVLAGVSIGQKRYELTVPQAVELAFKNLIELKNAQIDYRIQVAQNKEVTGQALPQISANVSANRYLELPKFLFPDYSQVGVYGILIKEGLLPGNTKIPSPAIQQVSFQQPWNLTAGATLSQLLFQPDVFVGLKARQTALDLSAATIEQIKARVKDSAYKRYYAIMIAEKQLYFINQGIARLEKLFHDDSLMFRNGFAERLDLDKVQVQLNNLRTTQSLIESGVTLGYATLKFSLGVSQKDTVVLKEDLSDSSIKKGVLDESFDYQNRPEIRTLNFSKRLQELNVKRYEMGYLPTISLSGNYSVNALGPKFFTDPNTVWLRSSFIGMNLNLPLFTGFQRKYKIQEARLGVEKVDNSVELVKQGIDLEQAIDKETLRNALFNLDLQQRNLDLASRVYNMTKLKFEQGIGSSFEVLQSDTDYQTAQSNYFNALYNAVVARISYLYSLGKL